MWLVRETEHFTLYYWRKYRRLKIIDQIASRVEAAYRSGSEWFGVRLGDAKPKVYLAGWVEKGGLVEWSSLGSSLVAADESTIWQFVSPAHPAIELERAVLELFARASGSPRSAYTPELLNALALIVISEHEHSPSQADLDRKMYERHVLKRLAPNLFRAEENAEAIDAIAAETSFLFFLRDAYGQELFLSFIRRMLAGEPDAVARAVYSEPLASLERKWLASLKQGFQSAPDIWGVLRQSLPLIRPYWARLLVLLLCMTFDLAFSLAVPLSIKYLYDDVIATKNYNALAVWSVAIIAASALGAYVSYWRLFTGGAIGELLLQDLRRAVFTHIQKVPLAFFAQTNTGDLLSRVVNDTDKIQVVLGQHLPDLIFQALSLFVFTAILLYLNAPLALLIMLGLPLFNFIQGRYTARLRVAEAEQAKSVGSLTSFLQENLSAQPVVRAFGLEEMSGRSFGKRTARLLESSLTVNRYFALMLSNSGMVNLCLRMIVLAAGALLVIRQRLSLGDLIAFIAMLTQILYQVTSIMSKYPRVQAVAGAFERLQELMSEPLAESDGPLLTELPEFKDEIRLEEVGFSYHGGAPALQGVSLRVKAGANVAIVGPSGSGKSTLINLLLRLYEPTEGRILFDGHDLQSASLKSLRRQIALVQQDTLLFNASIMDNIRVGNETASDSAVQEAARVAFAHEFIETMKDGYQTLVGERGASLSGGQRQRLAIARALVRSPRLLIFDEATSALDNLTEAELRKSLAAFSCGRTTIHITHRFTSVTDCDVIYVLDHGRLVETGTHDELISKGGLYRRLYEEQADATSRASSGWGIEVERLRAAPIFSDLDVKTLVAFTELSMMEHYAPGEEIIRQGEVGSGLYIITNGQAEVVTDYEGVGRRINILHAGDYFGEMSLIAREPRSATVRALVTTSVYYLSRRNFYTLVEREPSIREALSAHIADRQAQFVSVTSAAEGAPQAAQD